jgi:hypothetical protein
LSIGAASDLTGSALNLHVAPAPAASAAAASSKGAGWSAFQMSLLGTSERDISQWEDAMTKELASLMQAVDQVFTDWGSAVLNPGEPATSR